MLEVDEALFADAEPLSGDGHSVATCDIKVSLATLRIYKMNSKFLVRLTFREHLADWMRNKLVNITVAGAQRQWLRFTLDAAGGYRPFIQNTVVQVHLGEVDGWPQRELYAACEYAFKDDVLYIKLDDDWRETATNPSPNDVLKAMQHAKMLSSYANRYKNTGKRAPRCKEPAHIVGETSEPAPVMAEPSIVNTAGSPVDPPHVRKAMEEAVRSRESKPLAPVKTKPQPKKQIGTIPITTICPHPNAVKPAAKPGKLSSQFAPSTRFEKAATPDYLPPAPPTSPAVSTPLVLATALDPAKGPSELPPIPPDARPGSFWYKGKLIQPKTEEEKAELRKQMQNSKGPSMLTEHQQQQEKEALGKRGNAARFGAFKRS
jgi:hypothetical protein